MTLREYLKSKGMTAAWLARKMEISYSSINNMLAGRGVSKHLAYKVEQFTEGAVPALSVTRFTEPKVKE